MYTGGYDIALRIDEGVFNRALAALYYKGIFYVKRAYTFDSANLPPTLKQLAEINYEVKLDSPPFIDFKEKDTVNIMLNALVILYLFGNLKVKINADMAASIKVVYSDKDHSIKLDVANALITAIHLDDTLDLDEDTLKKLNDVISVIIKSDILQKLENINLPASLFELQVPTVPASRKLPVNRFDGEIVDGECFQAGIDLFHNTDGDFNAIQLGAQADYSMAITEKVIQQIIDFWWLYTTSNKSVTESKSDHIDKIDTVVNDVMTVAEVALAVATLGVLDVDTKFSNSTLNYSATITLGKPTVDIAPGDLFSLVHTHVFVDLSANVKTDITTTVKIFGGCKCDTYNITDRTLFSLSKNNIDITLNNATGKIYLNDQLQLMGKIESVDIHIDLGKDWTDKLLSYALNTIIGWVKNLIISNIPELTLFPKIINFYAPTMGYTLKIEPQELSTTDDSVLIRLNADIKELESIKEPLPNFIGNKHTMEVHRIYCSVLDEMNEVNKVGYFALMDAIKDGYDTCGKCIPWYSQR